MFGGMYALEVTGKCPGAYIYVLGEWLSCHHPGCVREESIYTTEVLEHLAPHTGMKSLSPGITYLLHEAPVISWELLQVAL